MRAVHRLRRRRLLDLFLTAMLVLRIHVVQSQEQTTTSVTGRLATVEPANRRLTLLPLGEVDMIELFIDTATEVWHEDRELSLSDLVTRVGYIVHVDFRMEGGERIAERIIVEPQ